MTYREKQAKFMLDISKFIVWLNEQGYEVTCGEFERTAMMAEYYKKIGKSKAGDKSLHCKRMACDINIFKNGKLLQAFEDLEPLAAKWESYDVNNSWGGMGIKGKSKLYDYPHFSRGEDSPEWARIVE